MVNNATTGASVTSTVNAAATRMNTTCTVELVESIFMNMTQANSSLAMPRLLCSDDTNDGIFRDVLRFACDPASELESTVNLFAIYYVAMGVAVLLAAFLANALMNGSAYRQSRRIRQAFYKSILYQEIGWYDVSESNEMTTRLIE